jgi:ParB-like chromosome segregation protein Spo0J
VMVLARQWAENAHRADLAAVAQARAIAQLRAAVVDSLSGTQGSRKPDERPGDAGISGTQGSRKRGRPRKTKAATVTEIDELTGQRMAELTMQQKGMTGRQVRNYLSLLTLPPEAQALAEAARISEKALRPLTSLRGKKAQVDLVRSLATGEMTPSQVKAEADRLKSKLRKKAREETREGDGGARAYTRFVSLPFAAGELPDPVEVAEQVARLPERKRAHVLESARRYVSFLQGVFEAVETLLQPVTNDT